MSHIAVQQDNITILTDVYENVDTKKKTLWVNTCEFIIYHHTWWTLNFKAQFDYLSINPAQSSTHFVVWQEWEIGQIGKETDILWHAWNSKWWNLSDMNRYSIWIEIVWPWFTDKQRDAVGELVQYLSIKYNIPKEKILRHKDIAVPKWRKVDVDDSFWNNKYKSWNEYVNSIFSNNNNMTNKYQEIMDRNLQALDLQPLFESHDWLDSLNEWEIKSLIEIAIARQFKRLKW